MKKPKNQYYKDNGTGFQCKNCGTRKDLHNTDKSCPTFGEAAIRAVMPRRMARP